MERLFLQLIKKKLTSLNEFSPLTYHKPWNPPTIFLSSTKISEKIPHTNMSCLKSLSPPILKKKEGEEIMSVIWFRC